MGITLRNETKRDGQIGFHFREIEVEGTLFQLQYCSGPSFLTSGRTDQLYMHIKIVPSTGEDIEVYTLKRYPLSPQDAIVEHLLFNRKTRQIGQASDKGSLRKLVGAFDTANPDNEKFIVEMMRSYPSDFGEPLKPDTVRASDYDLIRMYFKHIWTL